MTSLGKCTDFEAYHCRVETIRLRALMFHFGASTYTLGCYTAAQLQIILEIDATLYSEIGNCCLGKHIMLCDNKLK